LKIYLAAQPFTVELGNVFANHIEIQGRLFQVPGKKETKRKKSVGKGNAGGNVKFEILGKAMIEKKVGSSGKTGRIYVPPEWVDHQVIIIKLD
jgi:hypothetical protein